VSIRQLETLTQLLSGGTEETRKTLGLAMVFPRFEPGTIWIHVRSATTSVTVSLPSIKWEMTILRVQSWLGPQQSLVNTGIMLGFHKGQGIC